MTDFLHQEYYGNSILRYLVVLGITIIGLLILRFIKRMIFSGLKKWPKDANKIVILMLEVSEQTILPLLYITLLYTSTLILNIPDRIATIISNLMMVVFVFFIIRILILIVQKSFIAFVKRQRQGDAQVEQLSGLLLVINIIGWSIGVMFLIFAPKL